jgi:hypothetical protein
VTALLVEELTVLISLHTSQSEQPTCDRNFICANKHETAPRGTSTRNHDDKKKLAYKTL